MKHVKKRYLALFMVLVVGLWSFTSPQNDKYFLIIKNLDIFATLFKEVNSQYVDEINPNTFMQTGINAMMSSLDPYTRFYPEDQIEDVRTETTGQYGSVGAIIGLRKGKVTVILPNGKLVEGKESLKRGDEILAVNGQNVEGNFERASEFLKGQSSSSIKLKVLRPTIGELELDVELAQEESPNVPYYGMLNDEIGIIKQTGFTDGTSVEVAQALEVLKGMGATKVVLDLRSNPGGLLNEAVNVSNIFIRKGQLVVNTIGKIEETNATYNALNDPLDLEIPLAVLTNSSSASASEIVAGVLQDYDRGVLIGQRSFGKGLVQRTMPLSYNSQMKVTIAKYYIPSGRSIQAIDYSNRNADGSVGKIADSLMTRYQTRVGRPVYDGGGVYPDFPVEKQRLSPIAIGILSEDLFFDFGNYYEARVGEITDVKNFQVTDQIYSDFKAWLADKSFTYSSPLEKQIRELRIVAEETGTLERIARELTPLEEAAAHSRDEDLDANMAEIRHLLKEEFIIRAFFEQGRIEASYQFDDDITKAIEVLSNSELYNKTLEGQSN
ncbi:MAG: S41 family peptidase [Roseivirga sp.]|nr:S41 family peptidase [Roseivirga sp.]